jgi:Glycosyl hydrolases family 39
MKSLKWLVLVFMLASGAVAPQSDPVQTYHLRPPAGAIPTTMFGLHIHRATTTTRWPSIPFGAWRLWDSYVVWANLEPQKGKWDFGTLDGAVSLAEQHGVSILMPLGMPPPWASERPTEAPAFRPGSAAPPRNMQDWETYVRTLAVRYKGRIHCWELWNEPNLKGFYTGNAEQMVALAKAAYTILKQVDPANELVSPAPTGGDTGPSWLESYLEAGGGEYADIIGYHFYVTPRAPEAMLPLIEKVRQVMAQNGAADKPLWDTETGWYIQDEAGDVKSSSPSWPALAPSQAQGYVARAYILSWAAGISRLYWYDWDGAAMGLTEPGGKVGKPAAYAYDMTEKWLVGARMVSCDSNSSGTWVCHITRDGGYNGYIVWNANGPMNFVVPEAWNVEKQEDLSGETQPLRPAKSVGIGIVPILLESWKNAA